MVIKMSEPPVCKADRLVHVLGARSAVYECTSLPTTLQLRISYATFSLKKSEFATELHGFPDDRLSSGQLVQ